MSPLPPVRPLRWPMGAVGAIVAMAVVAIGCGREEEAPALPSPPLPVKMHEVGAANSRGSLEYPGRLSAWQHSEMAFEVAGRIVDFRVVEGDQVAQGEILARLDPRDFEADVQKAKATLTAARADYQRYTRLFEEGVSPQADLDAKREAFEVSEADVRRAEKALEDADLVAPFAGTVARKLVEDFQNVRRKEPVLILQDVTRLKITVAVPEADLTSGEGDSSKDEINKRIKAHAIVSSLPDHRFPAELGELALTADPTTRTFDATFYFDPVEGVVVLPGMTAKIAVEFQARGGGVAHRVPGAAVWADEAGNPQVWRVNKQDNTVERVAVTTGAMSGDEIQITTGLAQGDVVATSGVHQLTDGRSVRQYVR